jgi:hypothetical protein
MEALSDKVRRQAIEKVMYALNRWLEWATTKIYEGWYLRLPSKPYKALDEVRKIETDTLSLIGVRRDEIRQRGFWDRVRATVTFGR